MDFRSKSFLDSMSVGLNSVAPSGTNRLWYSVETKCGQSKRSTGGQIQRWIPVILVLPTEFISFGNYDYVASDIQTQDGI